MNRTLKLTIAALAVALATTVGFAAPVAAEVPGKQYLGSLCC